MQTITKTKELHAVCIGGKRITRFRTDLMKTRGIAHKTARNLSEGKSGQHRMISIRTVQVTKPVNEGSFAMIANQISPI